MKFSIIVPVYNVASYLRECLDSIRVQTCPDWECVCVDDGSTDGSASILDEYGAVDARFKIIHKTNGGVASARNSALNVIQGEWFLFVDSDDVVSSNFLEVCDSAAHGREMVDVVKFQHSTFEHGSCQPQYHGITSLTAVDYVSCRDLDFLKMGHAAIDFVYRRSVLGAIRQLPLTVGEDLHYMAQCVLKMRMMIICDAVLYGYRLRSKSAIHSPMTLKKARDGYRCAIAIYALFNLSKRTFARATRRWLGLAIFENAVWHGAQLKRDDRTVFFKEWHSGLVELGSSRIFLPLDKIRYLINRSLSCFAVAWLTGYIIEWLKRKGIHR